MDIQELYPEDLESSLHHGSDADFLLVDVRQPEEYEQEHIPGAKLMPLSELEYRLDELDEGRDLVFYCRSGKRSSAAAALARDSGLIDRSIGNLVGGISAWQGKVLDAFPNFQVLEDLDDLPQILKQAMNMEKGTGRIYQAMVSFGSDLPIKRTLEKLSKLETAHARVIYHQLSKAAQVQPFDELFDQLPGDIVEGGWDVDTVLKQRQEDNDNACLFLSELALELEYRAYDLYRTLAERTDDVERQKTFFSLAEQEKAHIRLLARGLPDCFAEAS